MTLTSFKPEIFAIARENKVDVGVGADMFIANIRNAGEPNLPYYKGAEMVNYSALKPHLKELQDSMTEFTESCKN